MLLATEKLFGSSRDARLLRAQAQSSQNQALDQTAACVQRCSWSFGPPLISFPVRRVVL
jgi:hypothetical protein